MSAAWCEVYLCDHPADYDLGRHRRVVGIPGWTRYICAHHARGRIKLSSKSVRRLSPPPESGGVER